MFPPIPVPPHRGFEIRENVSEWEGRRGVVCREAHCREEALEAIDRKTPDIILLDIGVVDGGGLDMIRRIRKEHPNMKTLVLTMRDESFYAERCFRVGAGS